MGLLSTTRAEGSANTALLSKVGLLFSLDMVAAAVGSYAGRDITSFWAILGLFVVSIVVLVGVKALQGLNNTAAVAAAAVFAFLVGTWSGSGLAHYVHTLGWSTVAFAFLGTSLAMVVFGAIGAFSGRNFSSWGPFLFNALLGLIIFRLILWFLPSMSATAILDGSLGIILFSGYFIYDFYKASHDDNSWSSAIDHSLEIFLDFVNFLFSLLEILDSRK